MHVNILVKVLKAGLMFSYSNGRYLISGGTDGCVYGWDVTSEGGEKEQVMSPEEEEERALERIVHWHAHADAVNGAR